MKVRRQTRRAGLPVATAVLGCALLVPACVYAQAGVESASSESHPNKSAAAALSAAKAQLARQDLAGAEASLWAVLGSDPNNVDALAMLAAIRGRQQRFPEAESLFRRVVQLNPKSAPAHRGLGDALIAQNKGAEAIEQYKAASELAPQDARLKSELAQLYVASGEFEQALSTLDGIPQARLPVEALPVKAAALLAVGKKSEAVGLIKQARQSPGAELDLAEVFLEGNLPDPALQCLELASVGLKRRPARFYYLKGRALQGKGETQAALSSLKQALDADPKSAQTMVALAEVYSSQNKHAEAVVALEKARAIDANSLPVLRHLVVEATKARDSKRAIDAASALSDLSPNNPDDLYLAGAAMLEQNVRGASSVLEKYVALRTDNARGWMGLGMAYVQQDRYADARKPLERAVQLDPTLAEAEYELGLVAKNEAKTDEAIQHLLRAVQLQPQHAAALRTLGNLYLQSADLEKAREALERAEAIDPNNLQTEYDLGLVLNKLGKTELARQHMEQFRKLKEAQAPAERQNP